MLVVADDVGEVLMECAAEGDVENLRTSADAEQRQPARQRPADQGQFPCVAIARRFVGARVRSLTVGGGVDVAAAGDHQTVETVEHAVDDGIVHPLRR